MFNIVVNETKYFFKSFYELIEYFILKIIADVTLCRGKVCYKQILINSLSISMNYCTSVFI
jgi:hypothetical protein